MKRFRLNRFGAAVLAVALVIGAGFGGPAAAQDGENSSPPAETTIHVVQQGETLFRIAMLHGTTVEAIAAANGIIDVQVISVGQRLLIPGAQPIAPGAVVYHTVKPGDSLHKILRIYNTTLDSVVTSNYLTSPDQLYVGQELVLSYGVSGTVLPTPARLHPVEAEDNIYRLALRYGVPLNDLLRYNALSLPAPLFAGQRLWIPGEGEADALVDLPLPFTACTIAPIPAVQGQTISVHLATTGPATLTGSFMGFPLQIATEDATRHVLLFGVHTFTVAGVYPMVLTAVAPDGTQTTLRLRIRVDDGGYGAEDISLETQQQDLLNTDVTEPEWQKVAIMMSGFTSQRYFDGLMGLPSTGAVTSQFGTRRAYNGGVLNTFHSGVDFGGAPGSSILAPAAGVVVLAESLPVRGNATIIDHGWGVYTGYWHQSEINVTVGDVVSPGQVIGMVGSTGRSTGPHLHWEMWVGGVQVDPMQWVSQSFP
ncbi:MAG: LysM peptidoglycan-binding domain-containing protein [Anaerolineae bacterium]|nr:LysM peptidoglycan-binding domain-containing protein [Anaerolineae bacterium]